MSAPNPLRRTRRTNGCITAQFALARTATGANTPALNGSS
jgi:hypothetical protein